MKRNFRIRINVAPEGHPNQVVSLSRIISHDSIVDILTSLDATIDTLPVALEPDHDDS